MLEGLTKVWLDGEFLAREAANVSLLSHTLHYGVGAFEGIRSYRRADGRSYAFRLREHIDRLFDSCKLILLRPEYTREQIQRACLETMNANGLDEGYIRPLVFVGDGDMGIYAPNNPVRTAILAWKWAAPTQGAGALERGIRVKFSASVRRHVNGGLTKAKIAGGYVSSVLAKREAKLGGYDESLLLDANGYVSEASSANVFIVRRGVLHTPDLASAILEGITRDSVIVLAREMGIEVVEGRLTQEMIALADEAFITGTASELTPIREVDDRAVGSGEVGPMTKRLQRRFFDIVRGDDASHMEWLTAH